MEKYTANGGYFIQNKCFRYFQFLHLVIEVSLDQCSRPYDEEINLGFAKVPLALLKAFRADSIFVRTRPKGGYEQVRPGWAGRVAARLRQLRLTLLWIHDHLWWGPGYAFAPLFWLAFAFFFITPPALNLIGLVVLFGLPAWTIVGVFRRFAPFVPGGLSWQDLVLLYATAMLLAWCHTWPVVYTHLLYAVGMRRCFRTWTATAKPQF